MRIIITALLCVGLLSGCVSPGKGEKVKLNSEPANDADRVIVDNDSGLAQGEQQKKRHGILVALDPGHQGFDVNMSELEPNAPGSSERKAKASTGTAGEYSGVPEYQLALDISLMLREELDARGYDVLLTREDNETAISNSQRAVLANESGADISVRIHANGSEDSGASGALALVPSSDNPYAGGLAPNSLTLAENVLGAYCEATGMQNQGVVSNDTMTGINWSTIPVIILEMGFMSNEQDDLNMQDADYRNRMVSGIADGIDRYYGFGNGADELTELSEQMKALTTPREDAGEKWAVYARRLSDGATARTGEGQMESASLIKMFIAACVFQNLESMKGREDDKGGTEELLQKMISLSDNDAANTLVWRLGNGDVQAGIEAVNSYCQENGYAGTHMGRLMLDSNASDDNYTTPEDCGKFLEALYRGNMSGAAKIMDAMKQQERREKIPAGIPENIETANKTGELEDVENDAAVIFAGKGAYVLCVMSEQLKDPQAARDVIKEISGNVYRYMEQ